MEMSEKTKMKDKIILVYYISIANIDDVDVNDYINDVTDALKIDDDDSVFQLFVPTNESDNCRVECINPVLVSEEKYAEALQKLEEAKERMDKAIEELSEKKNK